MMQCESPGTLQSQRDDILSNLAAMSTLDITESIQVCSYWG